MPVRRKTASVEAPRAGFTLVEVVAGLTLIGLVLAGTWALLESTRDGRDRIAQEAETADAAANGERVLASLFANADVSADSAHRFIGDEDHATFNTRCMVPQGWQENCRVSMQLLKAPKGRDVTWIVDSIPRVLRHFAGGVEFRYFGLVGSNEQWVNQWGKSIALPEAIALVADGDTVVVGGRGRQ